MKLIGKVANFRQVGGIETSVLDSGNEKGVRIAWVDTGSGLRFKVVLDRAMDIGAAFFNHYSLAWISHKGITPGNTNKVGYGWLDSFGGGLLTTCGLSHIGAPEKDAFGERGLHDTISSVPASIESIVQPNLLSGNMMMSITGKMIQSSVFGPHLELKRTISAYWGVPEIQIMDRVTNLGNEKTPHMLLYHLNFGWPLIDKGTKLIWSGKWSPRERDNAVFAKYGEINTCKSALEEHAGANESVAFIDVDSDTKGDCISSVINNTLGLKVDVLFKKVQLPWLTNWQHWGWNEYVTALEPGTNPPVGQAVARKDGTLIFLQPGEKLDYQLKIRVTSG